MTDLTPRQLVLQAGIDWLTKTVQPDGAMPSIHGHAVPAVVDNRRFRFIGSGHADRAVLVVAVVEQEYTEVRDAAKDVSVLVDGVVPAEMDAIQADLDTLGVRVTGRWNGGENGYPNDSGSFGLDIDVHESHRAGLARYRRGCPDHGSVFCGRGWGQRNDSEDCTWLRDGTRLVVPPTSPLVASS